MIARHTLRVAAHAPAFQSRRRAHDRFSALPLLKGKKALVTGIANDQSIAWGCAKAFRAFGADLAITYLTTRRSRYVEPLAKEVEAPIFMPLDVQADGQLEAVFERIEQEWGKLDICVHSIAFAPKADLQGRVVDCSKEGFLLAMEVSCWSFIRMAKLAEPLMKDGGTLSTMTYYGSPDGGGALQHHGSGQGRARSRPCAISPPSLGPRASGCTRSRPVRSRRARHPASPISMS